VYNADKTIGPIVRQVKEQHLEAIVVDDGSTDRTAAIASEHGALVISHLRNEGKGAALRTGFAHALRAKFDGVVTLDGDGQHDPIEIRQLVKAGEVQHAGMVVGNRMASGGEMPSSRRFTNRLMSAIVSWVARQRIPDSQCGFRFIRRELLEAVQLQAKRYEIETELVCAAARKKWKIISIPVRSIYQEHVKSYIQPARDTLRFLAVISRYVLP
jgi:glycosyltransferase involved in cell wall biosynthesis